MPRSPDQPPLPELLAPVGDFTCLTAAVQGGCDAVYFGVGELNMRSGTPRGFRSDDLPVVAERAHAAGIRAYLALNTIVFSGERGRVADLLDRARDTVDAVICWDPCVIGECARRNLPVHLSTQASVANADAARFYRDLGVRRIVPARECTLEELRIIRDEAGVELEIFIHGAMCMAVSGRCFLSQDTFGRSANRGQCLQNCRREYRITDVEEGAEHVLGQHTVLSARDLCTLPFLDTLLDAGFHAFKIEERARNPEYVKTVVQLYRAAMTAWREGHLDDSLKSDSVQRLRRVFNREFSEGFYLGRPIAEFATRADNRATRTKQFVGVVTNYYAKACAAEILVQSTLIGCGDTVMVQGATTGTVEFELGEIRQRERPVQIAERGTATIPAPERVRRNDKVYVLNPT